MNNEQFVENSSGEIPTPCSKNGIKVWQNFKSIPRRIIHERETKLSLGFRKLKNGCLYKKI